MKEEMLQVLETNKEKVLRYSKEELLSLESGVKDLYKKRDAINKEIYDNLAAQLNVSRAISQLEIS